MSDADVNLASPRIVNNLPGNDVISGNTTSEKELDKNQDPNSILNKLRIKNLDRLIVGHLNVNSIRHKFVALESLIKGKIDILVVSETKIDNTFPDEQFCIEGYNTPFRYNRNCDGGGLLVYLRSDIPCKKLDIILSGDIEGLFIDITLRKKKWLLFAGYNPKKEYISPFLSHVGKSLDNLMGKYENLLLLGDFNSEMKEDAMKDFCDTYNLQNLIVDPTCFKNPLNPSRIDMILTNRVNSFENSLCIETGISDYHLLTVTVLKVHFKKLSPTLVKYRNYRNFDILSFKEELKNCLDSNNKVNLSYDEFKDTFLNVLNKHAPTKEKLIRGNNAPFMNKTLSKAFMNRAKLKNIYNKTPTEENYLLYKKQRNYCTNLLKRVKKDYYNNLNLNIFKDNKTFWKNIRPLFSDKQKGCQKEFILIENDLVTSDEKAIADKLNNYFLDVIKNLDIEPYTGIDDNQEDECNFINMIVLKYKNHPSILKIKNHVIYTEKFAFSKPTTEDFTTHLLSLDSKKASVENDIPTKILIETKEITSDYLTKIYHESLDNQIFPNSLKRADVIPLHKKDERTSVKNYRPISLLPSVSKLYEKDMYSQILNYIEQHLSPYLFGFRKGHSTEQCINVMLENWKKALDGKKHVGAVLTDLSKAFDCLNHELLVAKLEAYGFGHESLTFILNYLSNRVQRTKVKSSYSSYREIKYGVPQGSILGPLLFNIFLNDIFLFVKDAKITNYADDTTPYAIENSIEKLVETLERDTNILLDWFKINEMKSNTDKCHLMIVNSQGNKINIGNEVITDEASVKLLGITIDNKLNFNEHVSNICKKANQKLHALARIAGYLDSNKLRIIMKTFIDSQFNYCPLTWMFHSRQLNTKINRLHERALRIVYKNPNLTFQQLLVLDKSFCIHHRNLQKLAVEMFKIKNKLVPTPMQELFPEYDNIHNLRSERFWETFNVRTVGFGTETLLFRGKKTWLLLPDEIRNSNTLSEFKAKIKNWTPTDCTCRLCKTFIHNLGFI